MGSSCSSAGALSRTKPRLGTAYFILMAMARSPMAARAVWNELIEEEIKAPRKRAATEETERKQAKKHFPKERKPQHDAHVIAFRLEQRTEAQIAKVTDENSMAALRRIDRRRWCCSSLILNSARRNS
jgi:hypothetical protein